MRESTHFYDNKTNKFCQEVFFTVDPTDPYLAIKGSKRKKNFLKLIKCMIFFGSFPFKNIILAYQEKTYLFQ